MNDTFQFKRDIRLLGCTSTCRENHPIRCLILIVFMTMIFSLTHPTTSALAESDSSVPVDSVDFLTASMEDAIKNERVRLSDLKERVRRFEQQLVAIKMNVSAYETQNTAHENLFLIPHIDSKDIEKALLSNRLAVTALKNSLKAFLGKWDEGSTLVQQVKDRISLGEKQLAEIQQTNLTDTDKQKLIDLNKEFLLILVGEKEIVVRYANTYQSILGQMKNTLTALERMGQRLETLLREWAHKYIFTRTDLFRDLFGEAARAEMRRLSDQLADPFTPSGMKAYWERIKLSGGRQWTVFFVLLMLTIVVQARVRRGLEHIEPRFGGSQWRYCLLALQLLRRSSILVSLALFFTLCYAFNWTLFNIGLAWFLARLFQLLLFRRWGLDYFKLGLHEPPTPLQTFAVKSLQRFIRITWPAIIFIHAITWFAGRGSPLTTLATLIISVWILLWTVFFWRAVPSIVAGGVRDGQAAPSPKILNLLRGWSFLVSVGAFLLGISGYIILVDFWIILWIYTVATILWAWISFQAIQEYRLYIQSQGDGADTSHPSASGLLHLRWALVQVIRVVWFFVFAGLVVRIWDRTGYVSLRLADLFDLTLRIGNLTISLKSISLAVLIIFLTHMINRIGRSVIAEKALEKQTLERGLKDSILTITSYLIWGLGLVLALGTLGVNATSLAVVFGAISIGIGFGLQNIFNNFISGLILLFERPIQVGDTVEVNGLWAEVKKINVRATVVQTYDNASVIIPNSDFISLQVTNWSFKDTRMRRNVDVGVAYGSDIDLVRKTLLEIAADSPNVLKYPRPEVIFMDHGDSALIFRLRIWTHVDNYWIAPSEIRFDLDKRFREFNIEIAFPQRDVHIRSITKTQVSDQEPIDALK